MADRKYEFQVPMEWDEGSDVPVTAILWDDKRPAKDVGVQIYVNGDPKPIVRTKDDGRATTKLKGLKPGKHVVSVRVVGSTHIESNSFWEIVIKAKPRKSGTAKKTSAILEETALRKAESALARATAPAPAELVVSATGTPGNWHLAVTVLDANGNPVGDCVGNLFRNGKRVPFITSGTGTFVRDLRFKAGSQYVEVCVGKLRWGTRFVGPKPLATP
ncbi:MAG: hypothetical protein HYT39_03665 [Candidatus Sungbacteria bacterium]|nr:hypothetical protein [Candidatus Sungbacteria bacterium]